jgi:hypothetical protein
LGERELTIADIEDVAARACAIAYPRGVDVGMSRDPRELLMRAIARFINSSSDSGRGPATARRDARGDAPRLKNLLNNAQSMTMSEYVRNIFPMEGYFATDKADGERGLAIIDADGACAIISDTMMIGACNASKMDTIYDGEIITSDASGSSAHQPPRARFYAFDCLLSGGESMLAAPFESRLAVIASASDGEIAIAPKKFIKIQHGDVRAVVDALYVARDGGGSEYEIDGLIFTQNGVGYFATRNYKWKPMESNTIDFLCLRCPEKLYGSGPYVLPSEAISVSASARGRSDFRIFLLFCGCSERQRAEYCIQRLAFHNEIAPAALRDDIIQFACRYEPYAFILVVRERDIAALGGDISGRVVEMRWRMRASANDSESTPRASASSESTPRVSVSDGARGAELWRRWDMLRIRADRTNGNNISTATSVFANYVNPFPLEALWQPSGRYFEHDAGEMMIASDKFRRFILTMAIYNNARDMFAAPARRSDGAAMPRHNVLDLGGGRAGDFVRYAVAGASCVVNFDIDAPTIAESVGRVEVIARKGIAKSAAAKWLGALGENIANSRGHGSADRRTRDECAAPMYIGRVADLSRMDRTQFSAALIAIGFGSRMFDLVASTFAFHYFCASREMVARIFSMIDFAMSDAGIVLITTMNGERVAELLAAGGGIWSRSEPANDGASGDDARASGESDGVRESAGSGDSTPRARAKYEIREVAGGAGEFGRMIRVSVPFSDEMREEPLCNFSAVRAVAGEMGFKCAGIIDYGDPALYDLFRSADPALAGRLTAIDREYTALYGTMIFKRAARMGGGRARGRKK